MDKPAVNVSSVRSRFENGAATSNNEKNEKPKVTPRTKTSSVVSKNGSGVTRASSVDDDSDGEKRSTLVREIQSLPKNAVMKRLQMFEGESDQAKDTKENSIPCSPVVAVKPSFSKSVIKETRNEEKKPEKELNNALKTRFGQGSTFPVKDETDGVELRQTTKRPPRPPPSYRRSSGSDDPESDTPTNSPRDKTNTRASARPMTEVQKSLVKEKPKQPSRPPPPCVKKLSLTEENPPTPPFTVTLVSKTSTQMLFPDKNDDDKLESVAKLTSKFQVENSPKPPRRVKPKLESLLSDEEKPGAARESKRVSAKPEVAGKPKLDSLMTTVTKAKLDVKESSERTAVSASEKSPSVKPRTPPKKPPPPKPPRTFEHDIYLEAKRRQEQEQEGEEPPLYEMYDQDQRQRYEPVLTRPEAPRRLESVKSDHSYETLRYGADPSAMQMYNNSQSSQDGSYRSIGYYSSVRSLQRSASDECLYAKPSTLRLLKDPLSPLYTVPNKKPPLPPKRFVDDGGYALPYVEGHFAKPASLKRSRSYREQLSQGLCKLDDHIRQNFERGTENGQVLYRREGRFVDIKPSVYNEVLHKVDEAYSLLSYHELEVNDHAYNTDHDSDDSDSQIDLGELQRRIQHVAAQREKNRSVFEKIRLFKDKLYPSLFQYALIVGLKMEDGTCVPEIRFSFPQFVSLEGAPIPDFCFPDKNVWVPVVHYESETFSFVLTRQDGSRDYGYCRRLLPGNQNGARLPVVVCIVSPLGAHQLYTQVLDEVEARFNISQDHAEELLQAVYARPLPSPGRAVQVKSMNGKGIIELLSFTRASDMRLENVNLDSLFACLSIENVIKVFSSVLLERRILLAATKLSTLTNCIHALVSLLYPLQWEHTFIPVLPQAILEMTCSPTPYIIGVLSVHLSQIDDLPTEEVLIVDLDTDQLHSPFDDENSIVPKKLQKALTVVVRMALEETDTASHRHLLLSEAFLRLFVEAIGHYAEHIVISPDGQKQFVKETFCKAVPSKSLRMFLEWLTETHVFQLFIMEQIESDKSSLSLFDTRIMEHRENLASMPGNAWSNFRQWAKKMGKAIKTNIKGQGEVKKK